MALKKSYQTGTKYNYANIENVNYIKNQVIDLRIVIYERDGNTLSKKQYNALPEEEKYKYFPDAENYQLEPIRSTGMQFTIPLQNNPEQFSIAYLNKKDNNLIKSCYEWLKTNVDLFNSKDWEDC